MIRPAEPLNPAQPCLDADIFAGDAEPLEEEDDGGQQLGLGLHSRNAHDVHVPLVVLLERSRGHVSTHSTGGAGRQGDRQPLTLRRPRVIRS